MDAKHADSDLLSIFDHIFVINLPHRTDRREEMAAQLARAGLDFDLPQVTLFAAEQFDDAGPFPSIGVRGCFMSHLAVLRHIVDQDIPRALILEDDADFSRHFETRLPAFIEPLSQASWDILYGWSPGRHHDPDTRGDARLTSIPSSQAVYMAHFIGVTHSVAKQCVPYLERMLARPPGAPEGGPMHVDGAYSWFRAAHPELRTVAPRAPLAVQRSSRSDITRSNWFDRIDALAPLLIRIRRARRRLAGN